MVGFEKNKDENVEATILIVDDDEIALEVLPEIVGEIGYGTISADSGEKALDIFREKFEEIDLVILDMFMPGKDGEAVFREMIKIDPDCKAILLSGNLLGLDLKKLSNLGFAGFLAKPVRFETLKNMIESIIGP